MNTSHSRMSRMSRRPGKNQTALLADKRCVLYVRGSTDDQQSTLESQQHEAVKFCATHGLELAHTFIDSGVSGSKPLLERKQARAALTAMKREGIATLLVMNLDRAFRNTVDMHLTIEHLLEHGYNFRMISPDLDLRGPVGRLVAGILGELAQFELACRSERQQRGFDSMRREKFARSQNAPYGWTIGPEIPGKLSHAGKPYRSLVPLPEEQAILRDILARYERQETLQAIADHLNTSNIPTKLAGQTMTRNGKTIQISGTWHKQSVKCVIAHAELAA